MEENPYASPGTTAEPVAADQAKTLLGRGVEFTHNAFRGLLAFFFFGFVPVFIVPAFSDMSEEFGIDLPLVLQYVVQLSRLAVSFSYAFLLISLGAFTGIEFGLFNLSRGRSKTLINVAYWLILILVIGSVCFAALNVYRALIMSLAN